MNEDEVTRDIKMGRKIAERLCQDLNIAISSWAHFEAINGESDQTRHQFRQAMHWLQVSHKGLLAAVIRDAILAMCRIVDDPRADGFSLIELSKLLNSEELRKALIKNVRPRALGCEDDNNFYANFEVDKRSLKIEKIRDHVPLQWNTKPEVDNLRGWRNDLIWPLRNKVLAHPGNAALIVQPKVDQIRYGLELINELVSAAHHIFVGSPSNTLNKRTRSANKFWDYAQVGFIEAFAKDQARRT